MNGETNEATSRQSRSGKKWNLPSESSQCWIVYFPSRSFLCSIRSLQSILQWIQTIALHSFSTCTSWILHFYFSRDDSWKVLSWTTTRSHNNIRSRRYAAQFCPLSKLLQRWLIRWSLFQPPLSRIHLVSLPSLENMFLFSANSWFIELHRIILRQVKVAQLNLS